MSFHRLPRNAALAAATACAALAITARSADAGPNIEIGGTAGLHTFSVNNELGVPDSSTAPSLRNSVLFGLRLGFFFTDMLGVEGELGIIPTETREDEGTSRVEVTALTYRVQLVAQFGAGNPDRKLIPFVVLGVGNTNIVSTSNVNVISKDGDESLHAGIGAKYRLPRNLGVRADVRAIFPPSSDDKFAAFDSEILLSVYYELGRKQKVPPPPIGDTDKDGLKDDVDKCINDPEDPDSYQDDDGCPEPDNDNDGVLDTTDGCPLDPEDPDQYEDEDGCPEPDNDADGILDTADGCPNDAEDFDQFNDGDGCPEPDNDEDGFLDGVDGCPLEPETVNSYQDDDGCPDTVPKAVTEFTGVIAGITFKTDSDEIAKSSTKTLDAAVKVLQEYPDTKLEVQGHTDDVGSAEYNLDLSQRRAQSVVDYLVTAGIDASRLTAVGYGTTLPISDKTTKAARAKNRRVEFKLVSSGATP